jgi:beta-galactosidase
MSLERLPKFSWWFFRSQRDAAETSPLFEGGPMVRIASYWTPGSSPRIRVFSNAEEVELKLNGRSLGRLRPTRDRISDRLSHPPFHFDAGRFEPGALEATAFIGGQAVATHKVETPAAPERLRVELDDAGVPPVAGDLVFARAHVLDAKGNAVPTAQGTVRFRASGDFEIVGPAEAAFEAGIASVLVRTARARPGGSIATTAEGLRSGSLRR